MLSYEICLYLACDASVVLETALLGAARGGAEHLAHLSRGLGAMMTTLAWHLNIPGGSL